MKLLESRTPSRAFRWDSHRMKKRLNARNSDLPDFLGQTTDVERSAEISLVSTGHVRRTFFERSKEVNE